jgi:uncharacterized protein with HEPN domain
MLRYALARCLEIIGEAASQLSEETRAAAPGVPWSQVIGMRHRLAHAYFAINLNFLWDTVELDLRPLLAVVEQLLASPDDDR